MIIKHRAFFKAVLPQMPANVVQILLNSASEMPSNSAASVTSAACSRAPATRNDVGAARSRNQAARSSMAVDTAVDTRAPRSATKLANVIFIAHSRPAAGAAGASFTRAAGVFAASRRRTPAGVFAAGVFAGVFAASRRQRVGVGVVAHDTASRRQRPRAVLFSNCPFWPRIPSRAPPLPALRTPPQASPFVAQACCPSALKVRVRFVHDTHAP